MSVALVWVAPERARPDGCDGAVVSPGEGGGGLEHDAVVPVTDAFVERLPAASTASTANVYAVPHVRPVTEAPGWLTVDTSVLLR